MAGKIELAMIVTTVLVGGWVLMGLVGDAGRRYRWRQWEQWRDLHNGWQDRRGQYKGR